MYAIAIDGNCIATLNDEAQVLERLKDRQIQDKLFFEDSKIEIATFKPGMGWIPVCLDKFDLARAA